MFEQSTRRKLLPLSSAAKGTTNPLVWEIPKTGLLAGIYLSITGSISGTLSAPNALGKASIVRTVKLVANSGIDLINLTGAMYHYLLRNNIDDYRDPVPGSDARSAVATGAFDVSMFLPIAYNAREAIGLIMLQNEQTQLTLSVEFETDSVVATGATVTATVVPYIELFTVPVNPKDWPSLTTVQQIVGDSRVVAGAGDVSYRWPRGNTYICVDHGLGIGASPADGWTFAKVQLNQSDVIWGPLPPAGVTLEYNRMHPATRLVGTIPIDLAGTSGLGMFGSARDLLYSAAVTELETVITASGAGTLYTLRRQLVQLPG